VAAINLFSIFVRIALDSQEFERGINQATEKGRGFAKVISGTAKFVIGAATTMGIAITTVGFASARAGRDVDASMGGIRAQTKMTAEDAELLRKEWHRWSKDGGPDIREIAAAYADVAIANHSVEDALALTSAAILHSEAKGTSLAASLDFLSSYFLKTGKSASYGEKYVDLFAVASQNTQIGLSSLQNYLFRMTPAFQQFGAASESNIAILSHMYSVGIQGANLYSGMGTIMMDFATAGDISAAAINRFNVITEDANGNLLSNEEILFNTAKAMHAYSDQIEVARFVTGNMNQTQQAAWFEFMRQAEVIQNEVIPSFDQYGVAAEMAAKRIDPVQRGINSIQGAFTYLKDTVWDFIRVPVGEAFEGIANKMSGLATTFAPLLGDAVGGLVGILTGAEGASDSFAEAVGNIAEKINEVLPRFVGVGAEILLNLINGIVMALPTLIDGVMKIIPTILEAIMSMLPELFQAGIDALLAFVNGISAALPELIPIAIEATLQLVQGLIDSLPMVLDAALLLIEGLAQGLLGAMPVLIAALPYIIVGIVDFLSSSIPMIVDTGITLFMALIEAMPEIIGGIIDAIPQIITGIIDTLMNSVPALAKAGLRLLVAIVHDIPIAIGEAIIAIAGLVMSMIRSLIDELPRFIQAGRDLIQGIISGMAGKASAAVDAARNVAQRIWNGIRDFFRFGSSPSKMEEVGNRIGADLAGGISDGVTDAKSDTIITIADLANAAMNAAGSTLEQYLGIGYNKIVNMANGIQRGSGHAINAAKNVANAIDGVLGYGTASARFEREVGAAIPTGTARGIRGASGQAVQAAEEMSKDTLSGARHWIEVYRLEAGFLITEELKMWEHLTTKYEWGTRERIEVDRNVARIRQQLLDDQDTAQREFMAKHEQLTDKKIAAEQRYTNQLERTTQAFFNQFRLFQGIGSPEEQRANAAEAAGQRITRIEEQLQQTRERRQQINERLAEEERRILDQEVVNTEQLQRVRQNATRDLERLAQDEMRIREELTQANEAHGEAEIYASKSQGELMIANAREQLEKARDFAYNLAALAAQGIDDMMLGQKTREQIAVMASMTEEELQELAQIWDEGMTLASELAINELQELREETTLEVQGLMHDLEALSAGYGADAGKDWVSGVASAIRSNASQIQSAVGDSIGDTALPLLGFAPIGGLGQQVEMFTETFEEIHENVTTALDNMSRVAYGIIRRMTSAMHSRLVLDGRQIGRNFFEALGQGLIDIEASLLSRAWATADAIRDAFNNNRSSFNAWGASASVGMSETIKSGDTYITHNYNISGDSQAGRTAHAIYKRQQRADWGYSG